MDIDIGSIVMKDRKNMKFRFETDRKQVRDLYQKAWDLYEADDTEGSFELFMEAALEGHPLSQYMVGTMYLDGYGTEEDVEKAIGWLRSAAELGVPQAVRTLGLLLVRGDRIRMNAETGSELLGASAALGDPEGLYLHHLALMIDGRKDESMESLRRSAEGGYPPAMDRLGWANLIGECPGADRDTGMDLIRSAADKGNTKALVHLAIAMMEEDGDEAEIMRLCRESAVRGDTLGMITLGILISDGQHGNPETGAEWIRRAAEKGDPRAMRCLGEFIRDGRIAPLDGEDAGSWFRRAADAGDVESSILLRTLESDATIHGEMDVMTGEFEEVRLS